MSLSFRWQFGSLLGRAEKSALKLIHFPYCWFLFILRAARNETSLSGWYPPSALEFETIPLVFVWICRRWRIQSAVRSDVTRLLDAAAAGDRRAAANLLSFGYNELRKFAAVGRAAAAPGEGVTGRREIRDHAIFRVLQPSPAVVTLP